MIYKFNFTIAKEFKGYSLTVHHKPFLSSDPRFILEEPKKFSDLKGALKYIETFYTRFSPVSSTIRLSQQGFNRNEYRRISSLMREFVDVSNVMSKESREKAILEELVKLYH